MLNSLIWDGTGRVKHLGLERSGNRDKQKPRNVRWRSDCTALEEEDMSLTLAGKLSRNIYVLKGPGQGTESFWLTSLQSKMLFYIPQPGQTTQNLQYIGTTKQLAHYC